MADKRFYIIDNFRNAFNGILHLIRYGRIFIVNLLIALLVLVAGFVFGISKSEWLVIILAIGLVLAAEGFNTAMERLSDHVSPDYHEAIKVVKDIAAGAVLLISIASAVAGLIIFIPYILQALNA